MMRKLICHTLPSLMCEYNRRCNSVKGMRTEVRVDGQMVKVMMRPTHSINVSLT